MPEPSSRPAWIAFLACAGALILWVLLSPMEWGVMDDVSLLRDFEARYGSLTFWQYVREFLDGERSWGLYRPAYAAWNYFMYGELASARGFSPSALYALTALLVFSALALFGVGFARTLPERERPLALGAYLLAVLAFTPMLNLVGLLSLQEKFPILGAAVALHFLSKNRRVEDVFGLLFFWIGPLAKSTGIVYGIPLLALLWTRNDEKRAWNRSLAVAFAAALCGWALFAKWWGSQGHYTRRYQWEPDVLARYFDVGGAWAWAIAALLLFSLLFALRHARSKIALSWPAALGAWIVLMLPWGILGYYWSAITPLVGATAGIAAVALFRGGVLARIPRPLRVAGLAVLLLALPAHFLYKTKRMVSRSVSTGEVARWLSSPEALAAEESWIAYPCAEASRTLALLAKRETELRMWRPGEPVKKGAFLLTWWECPDLPTGLPGKFELSRDFGAWKAYRYDD